MSIYKKVLNDLVELASVVANGFVELAFKLTTAIVVTAALLATYDGIADIFLEAGVPEADVPLVFIAWFVVMFNVVMKVISKNVEKFGKKIQLEKQKKKAEEYMMERYKKKPVTNEVEAL